MRAGGAEVAALAAYYRSPAARARMAEYCGGRPDDPASFTAVALAGYGGLREMREGEGAPVNAPLTSWTDLLDQGADVCRSLADRAGTLLLLDIDYTNHDDPSEPYRDPARTFQRMEPVYRATLDAFHAHGAHPLVLMTGRGYHFALKAMKGSPLHVALVVLGTLGGSLRWRYQLMAAETGASWVEDGSAHEGAGRLLESLAHEVMRAVEGRTEMPVTLADIPPAGGGPFVCLDLTAYADPLFTRNTRCAFAGNQKALVKGVGGHPAVVITLPRRDELLAELLQARVDPARALEMAIGSDARIPAVMGGVEWLSAYQRSVLARFHKYFDAGQGGACPDWPETYDALDLCTLPACAAFPLAQPNPALLTPGWLRTVALCLWAQGWHPRSIAGLVASTYARPHDWGDYWERYDPESRARFYVRVCCGALPAGLDGRNDFTCESQRARRLCPAEGCGFDLRRLWDVPRAPLGGMR